MLYMIELRYSSEHRDEALRYFWEHGSTRYAGHVRLDGAWVATQDLIAYALVHTTVPEGVAEACRPLSAFGEVSFRPVTSVDEI